MGYLRATAVVLVVLAITWALIGEFLRARLLVAMAAVFIVLDRPQLRAFLAVRRQKSEETTMFEHRADEPLP